MASFDYEAFNTGPQEGSEPEKSVQVYCRSINPYTTAVDRLLHNLTEVEGLDLEARLRLGELLDIRHYKSLKFISIIYTRLNRL